MKKIGRIERAGDPDTGLDVHQTSFAPGLKPETPKEDLKGEPDPDGDGAFVSDFLPCHYFGLCLAFLITIVTNFNRRFLWDQHWRVGNKAF